MESSTSSSSSSLLPAPTDRALSGNEGTQDHGTEQTPQEPPSRSDGERTGDSSEAGVPPGDTLSNQGGPTPSLRRRRRRKEHADANRGQQLQAQLSERRHNCQQQPQQQPQQQQPHAPETERETTTVLPATTETLSRKSLLVLRPVHKYVDLVCICLSVLAYLLETTMNAALAIFGIGVGVGLVLGDSFRAALPLLPSVQVQQQQQQQMAANANGTASLAASDPDMGLPRDVPNLLPAQ